MARSAGFKLPPSLRSVLTTYSAAVDIAWQLPPDIASPLRGIFAGECRWSLPAIPTLLEQYREWRDGCFSDPADPYHRVWHNKFPVLAVGTGDMIGIDLADDAVVYLSHDDSEAHGFRLGRDFADYVDRLSLLGCVGAEDWQWLHFVTSPQSLLQPNCSNAGVWREWFGLSFTRDAA